jgi:predicted metal-dependent hydrolase
MNQPRFAFEDAAVPSCDPGLPRRTRPPGSNSRELVPAAPSTATPAPQRPRGGERRERGGAPPPDVTRPPARPADAAPGRGAPLLQTHGDVAFIRHPRAKRYVVRVNIDGSVRVTIPRWGSKRDAAAFAESQGAWIAKQRERAARERARPRPAVPSDIAAAARCRAHRELPLRLRELAERFGCLVSRISIRNQRSRWGSCSRAGHICLNWRLMLTPDWVRDYVLIHELMHLKRMDHSPKFWKLVEAACPEWREARQWLRKYESTTGT